MNPKWLVGILAVVICSVAVVGVHNYMDNMEEESDAGTNSFTFYVGQNVSETTIFAAPLGGQGLTYSGSVPGMTIDTVLQQICRTVIYGTPTTAGTYTIQSISNGSVLQTTTIVVSGSTYSHTVIYNANGGSGTMNNTVVTDGVNGNTSVTLSTTSSFTAPTGKYFYGWGTSPNSVQPISSIDVGANESVTVYALWSDSVATITLERGKTYSNDVTIMGYHTYSGGVPQTITTNHGLSFSSVVVAGMPRITVSGVCYEDITFTINVRDVSDNWVGVKVIVGTGAPTPSNGLNLSLGFGGNQSGTYYVKTGTNINIECEFDDGGNDEFGAHNLRISPSAVGITQSYTNYGHEVLTGKFAKVGTYTVTADWFNGANDGTHTITIITSGDTYYVHNIHYNANGGTGSMTDSSSFDTSTSSTLSVKSNSFLKSGMTFKEWNTKADGTGTTYTSGQSLSVGADQTVNLYAIWQDASSKYGSATNPLDSFTGHAYYDSGQTIYVKVGGSVTINGDTDDVAPISCDSVTSGFGLTTTKVYTTDFGQDVYNVTGTITKAGNIRVTLNEYEEDTFVTGYSLTIVGVNVNVNHTLTYDLNGGTGTIANTVVTDGNSTSNVTVTSTVPTKAGYTFLGWQINGSGTVYKAGQTVPVGANATVKLVANWQGESTTIDIKDSTGQSCYDSATQKFVLYGKSGTSSSYTVNITGANVTSKAISVKTQPNGNGLGVSNLNVTYTAGNVTVTNTYSGQLQAVVTYSDGHSVTTQLPVTIIVDPVLDFSNVATAGGLAIKGAGN